MSIRSVDLNPELFPLVIGIYDPVTSALLWTCRVDEPGLLVVPGFGQPVRTVINFGDGSMVEEFPNGASRSVMVDGTEVRHGDEHEE